MRHTNSPAGPWHGYSSCVLLEMKAYQWLIHNNKLNPAVIVCKYAILMYIQKLSVKIIRVHITYIFWSLVWHWFKTAEECATLWWPLLQLIFDLHCYMRCICFGSIHGFFFFSFLNWDYEFGSALQNFLKCECVPICWCFHVRGLSSSLNFKQLKDNASLSSPVVHNSTF